MEGLYRNLQWISSNGLLLLYEGLWQFVVEESSRKRPEQEQEGIGALENLLIAFQLYFLFDGLAVVSFLLEIAYFKIRHNFKIVLMLLKLRRIEN